ncbi:MAG: transposase [Lentisphaerae bacterium]|nr:transposase [Lentisphaerota bacterium]
MARPLRIDVEDGWYHITARGIERRAIFHEERYYTHFLELLEELTGRFSIGVHAYVMMDNHYHLLLQSPRANVSAAMQWLNVSYSAWFNAKRNRVGHVFQGRFNSRLIDGNGSWVLQASVYVHLNPVRVSALGLNKQRNQAERKGLKEPAREEIRQRLDTLNRYPWSSYRAYAGYSGKPKWLQTEAILARSGGKARYRKYVQLHVTRGEDPEQYERLKDKLIIGGTTFVEKMKKRIGRVTKEQPERKLLDRRVPLDEVVRIVEKEKGEKWDAFRDRHGDWGMGLVLYLARKCSGCTLREIGDWLGGVDYKTVSKTVERFGGRLQDDKKLAKIAGACLGQMSNVET